MVCNVFVLDERKRSAVKQKRQVAQTALTTLKETQTTQRHNPKLKEDKFKKTEDLSFDLTSRIPRSSENQARSSHQISFFISYK